MFSMVIKIAEFSTITGKFLGFILAKDKDKTGLDGDLIIDIRLPLTGEQKDTYKMLYPNWDIDTMSTFSDDDIDWQKGRYARNFNSQGFSFRRVNFHGKLEDWR